MKLTEKEFDKLVRKAIGKIPSEFGEHLDNVVITVMKRPTENMLRDEGVPHGETLLGLYQGIPLPERTVTSPPLYPDAIFLFQEPLEQMCETFEELEEEIEITVVHEIAHFMGMTEERLAELGYE